MEADEEFCWVFTPKFGKKNVGTRSFQDCVIKESIRCESVSTDLDVMSESAILWMTLADGINGAIIEWHQEDVSDSTNKENWGPGYY